MFRGPAGARISVWTGSTWSAAWWTWRRGAPSEKTSPTGWSSIVADLAELPLPDNSADLIVSTASLHHWTDVGAVIASLGRVLRPDGRIWIYDVRLVPAGSVRAASLDLGRRVDRTLVCTGWFPAAGRRRRRRGGWGRRRSRRGGR